MSVIWSVYALVRFAVIALVFIMSACRPVTSSVEPTIVGPHNTSTAEMHFATATLISTPANTPTRRPTSTVTSAPTLTAGQRVTVVEQLLATNDNCKLPCWWGISPGKSKWLEVEGFILSMGAKTGQQTIGNGLVLHETGGFDLPDKGIRHRISLIESSTNVIAIMIVADGRSNSEAFKDVWLNYWPDKILSVYGKPSRILLKTFSRAGESSPEARTIYSLWMFYDDQGILIRYGGTTVFDTTYRICPSYAENGNLVPDIEIYLQSPVSSVPINDLARQGLMPETSLRSLEDATGVSIDQFVELLLRDPQNACIETPRDIWP